MKINCLHDGLKNIVDLKPNPKNMNKHPADQIARLAKILEYQGWRYPVKVSKQSGFITSGHGRIEAAKLNGWTQVPVNFQDYDDEDQEYADLVADNSIASWADLDLAMINLEIGNLGPDLDLDLLGLKSFDVDPPMTGEAPDPGEASMDPDAIERIVFYYNRKDYEEIVSACGPIIQSSGVTNMSELFKMLVLNWKSEN